MPRPRTASRCGQKTTATVPLDNKPVPVICQRGEGHKGLCQGPLKFEGRRPAMR